MKKIKLFLLIFLSAYHMQGQKEFGQSWIIGAGFSYKVTFDNSNILIQYLDTNYNYYFSHGCSSISDISGSLKIISNGYQVFDQAGVHLENGDSLVPNAIYNNYNGFSLASQSSIILPLDSGIYYLITPTASDLEFSHWMNGTSAYFDLLLYHKIDMNENGGAGKVVEKAIPLLEDVRLSKTEMMACRHGSGIAWWLFKQAADTNMVYKFLVTKDSIYNMGKQGFKEPHFGLYDLAGQSMFNETGTQYATTSSSLGTDYLFLADFDRCSGNLSSPVVFAIPDAPKSTVDLSPDNSPGGMCFSPNGRFIYLVKYYNIFQLDLNDPDSVTAWYHVANLDTTTQAFNGYGNAYIGPDEKVYISNWGALSKQMSYIENPDVKGPGCVFCPRCLRFPKWGVSSVPCMPNYALGKDSIHNCPLPTFPPTQGEALLIYPNPSSGIFTIESSLLNQQENEILVLSINGEKLYRKKIKTTTGKIDVDISHLAAGIYILRVGEFVRKVVKE